MLLGSNFAGSELHLLACELGFSGGGFTVGLLGLGGGELEGLDLVLIVKFGGIETHLEGVEFGFRGSRFLCGSVGSSVGGVTFGSGVLCGLSTR